MVERIELGKALEKAIKVLKSGGLVVYPTETSYGIGADALNPKVVERVHAAKKQPKEKSISVIVASERQADEIAEIDENARKLIREFMTGPLTLVI